jgi:hypothetical protein
VLAVRSSVAAQRNDDGLLGSPSKKQRVPRLQILLGQERSGPGGYAVTSAYCQTHTTYYDTEFVCPFCVKDSVSQMAVSMQQYRNRVKELEQNLHEMTIQRDNWRNEQNRSVVALHQPFHDLLNSRDVPACGGDLKSRIVAVLCALDDANQVISSTRAALDKWDARNKPR